MNNRDKRILTWIAITLFLSGVLLYTCSCSTIKPCDRTNRNNTEFNKTAKVNDR